MAASSKRSKGFTPDYLHVIADYYSLDELYHSKRVIIVLTTNKSDDCSCTDDYDDDEWCYSERYCPHSYQSCTFTEDRIYLDFMMGNDPESTEVTCSIYKNISSKADRVRADHTFGFVPSTSDDSHEVFDPHLHLFQAVFGKSKSDHESIYKKLMYIWSESGSIIKASKIKHYLNPISRTLSYVVSEKDLSTEKKTCPHVAKRKSKYTRHR